MSEMAVPRKRSEKGFGGPSDLQDAWRLLAGGAPKAVKTLRWVSEHGTSEPSRVLAAKTILEMTGFGGRDVVPVRIVPSQFDPTGPTTDGRISPAQIIRDRMALLRQPAYDPDLDSGEVVDAEIVDEPTI